MGGYTLKEFSAALDVSINTVYRWEKGKTVPRISILRKIIDKFDLTSDYFFENEFSDDTNPLKDHLLSQRLGGITEEVLVSGFNNLTFTKKYALIGYMTVLQVSEEN